MTHGCSELYRRSVVDAGGLVLGEVEEILVDPVGWKVSALRVKLRRGVADEVGVASSFFRRPSVEIASQLVQSVGDAVLLNVRAHDLHDASAEATAHHAQP